MDLNIKKSNKHKISRQDAINPSVKSIHSQLKNIQPASLLQFKPTPTTLVEINQHATNQMVLQNIQDILRFITLPNRVPIMDIYFYLLTIKKRRKKSKEIQRKVDEAIEFLDSTRMRGHST